MFRSFGEASWTKAAVFVLMLAAFATVSLAQNSSLNGTVRDPQGAVVPGATVTLTGASGATRTAVTDDLGRYSFLQVTPGTYRIRTEQTGFKVAELTDVRLVVDTPKTLDIPLELGDLSEVVTVSTTSEGVLNQRDATIGNAFNEKQIVELPLNRRNVVDLLSLQPGVDQAGNVTGARSDQSNLTLDGIDVNEQQTGDAFQPVLRVTPDSVQEFRVTVSNPGANQGRSSGAQVSLVTKSGTNDFHGSLYEFHRNTVTSANEFFNNRSGVDTPALIRNLFGGSIGGPIKSDRAFFFFNYEGRTDRSQSSTVRVVPLSHLGLGQIRYNNSDGQLVTLNTEQLNTIYPVGINPAAVAAMGAAAAAYPANDNGQGDGLNTGGFRFNASTPLDQNTYTGKLDFNLSDTQSLFVRGNFQWDQSVSPTSGPYLPGAPDRPVWSHPWGIGVGHTWTASPNIVNTFRYGITRQAFTSQGDSAENAVIFRFVFQPVSFNRGLARTTPVHNFTNDTSWVKGNHTFNFGTNIRLISNQRQSFGNAFDNAITNPSFYDFSGAVVSDPIADLASGSVSPYENAATALIGRYSQYTANFTFGADGSLLSAGIPSGREFSTEEFEFYIEDSWQVVDNLTLNLGLRWGYNSPVNETTGFQVAPSTPLGDYFDQRVASSLTGVPFNDSITVDVAGPFYGREGYYDKDWNNFQPRVSFAWTPSFDDGFLHTLFGGAGKSVFRGGFSLLYDRIGSALAVSFDLNNTLGFSSSTTIAANTYNVTDRPAPLFTGFGQDVRGLPGITVPASLAFPLETPADEQQRIESSLDSTLTTPRNYNWNFSIGRELKGGLFVEFGYVGRQARDLLATRDIMALNNLVDPASGMDWYTAAGQLAALRLADTPVEDVAPIPYFENLFPDFRGVPSFGCTGGTATQGVYALVARDVCDILDWTFIQLIIDDAGVFPNAFFHPQYAALSAYSTVADSDYHAFTFTARERFSQSLSVDFNYTLSKSIDTASGVQTSGAFGAAFILNPLRPQDSRALSDFDLQHIVNANWLWDIPIGHGRAYMADLPGGLDAILGGWGFNGIFRWNSGANVSAPFDRAQWATNWNVQSNGTALRDPNVSPNSQQAAPNFFSDPQFAYQSYRNALPGETGQRNTLRRLSFITVDFGLHKSFHMPYNEDHKLTFRWEVFNATNTQRLGSPSITRSTYGLGQDSYIGTAPPNWGTITSSQGNPRVMQFGLRYDF